MKTLKHLFLSMIGIGLLLASVSCNDDNDKTYTFEVQPTGEMIFNSGDTASKTFSITAENVAWAITVGEDAAGWLTVDKNSGNQSAEVKVSVEEYSGEVARSGKITVTPTGGDFSPVVINVTQNGISSDDFSFSPESLDFAALANEPQTIQVTSAQGVVWTVEAHKDHKGWLSVSKSGNTVTISVADNASTDAREGTIVFSTNLESTPKVECKVNQAGKSVLSVDKTSFLFESHNNTAQTFKVTSANTEWTIEKGSNSNWLTMTTSDNETYTLTVGDNETPQELSTTITLQGSGVEKVVITVKQKGITDIRLSKTEFTFEGEDNSPGNVTIETAGSFSVSKDAGADWISGLTLTGNAIQISVDEYLMRGEPRTANVYVKDDSNVLETAIITVTQNSSNYDSIFDKYGIMGFKGYPEYGQLPNYSLNFGSGDAVLVNNASQSNINPGSNTFQRFVFVIYTDTVFPDQETPRPLMPEGTYTNTVDGSTYLAGYWTMARRDLRYDGVTYNLIGNTLYEKINGTNSTNIAANTGSVTVTHYEDNIIKFVFDLTMIDAPGNVTPFRARYKGPNPTL